LDKQYRKPKNHQQLKAVKSYQFQFWEDSIMLIRGLLKAEIKLGSLRMRNVSSTGIMDKDNAKCSNKHRQEYTQDFKREALNLVETSGKSVPQVARDPGISASILYKWQKQLGNQGEQAFPGKAHQTPSEEELRRLRLEVEHLKQEPEILKKAVAIFAQSPK
jgi:transposase